jgi:hypothetical protein
MSAILVLGDGNFSFSRSLCQSIEEFRGRSDFQVVLTSYDSEQQLLLKYPECRTTLKYLKSKQNVRLCHSVNAALPLQHLLAESFVNGSINSYDYVIFNFPHLGVENSKLHSALLAHIIHQVLRVLSSNGIFYLTLADDQPTNWKL